MMVVSIVCQVCGFKRKRKVYGYEYVASWLDNEEVRCVACGEDKRLEITVEAQGK